MLTDTQKHEALATIINVPDPNDFKTINDQLCEAFPSIETKDLVDLWERAGERFKTRAAQLRVLKATG